MTERKSNAFTSARQTRTVRYLIGRRERTITSYLCCTHCPTCAFLNQHDTPCQHVDEFGRKNCIVGQMPDA